MNGLRSIGAVMVRLYGQKAGAGRLGLALAAAGSVRACRGGGGRARWWRLDTNMGSAGKFYFTKGLPSTLSRVSLSLCPGRRTPDWWRDSRRDGTYFQKKNARQEALGFSAKNAVVRMWFESTRAPFSKGIPDGAGKRYKTNGGGVHDRQGPYSKKSAPVRAQGV